MKEFLLNPINLTILVLYFFAMLALGCYFSRKNTSSEGYLIGNRNIPTWALSLSMISSMISSVTFLAMPAAAFALDWRMFAPNLSILIVAGFAVWLIVPFFRGRAARTTAFEYLDARFGKGARLYGAIMSLVMQSFRLGAVIYLMAIPLHLMTGISMTWVIVTAGAFCALYTILGGMEAVVWTDVIQAIVLYVGGVAVLIVMLIDIPGGLSEVIDVAFVNDKFSFGEIRWDLGDRTFISMLVIGVFSWISLYTSDQVQIQRFIAAKNLKEARKAGLMSAVMCMPTWAFFFFLGTTLYVYYQVSSDPSIVNLTADEVLPHFIMTQMPTGLNALVIAGILSAAMGSLSSSLNAFATVAITDIVKPYLYKDRSDNFYKNAARLMTALASLIMFGVGFAFAYAPKESFVDFSHRILGLVGGVLPTFFLLGFFVPRVNRRVLWQAFAGALTLNVYLVLADVGIVPAIFGVKIHAYLVSVVVMTFMMLFALLLAFVQQVKPEQAEGLTVFYNNKEREVSPDQTQDTV